MLVLGGFQHFVADQMQPDMFGLGPVKVESIHRLFDVGAQFFPIVSLGKNAFRQAFSGKASVSILRDLENDLVHGLLDC